MPLALGEFWTRLMRSGIADAEDCKKVASAFLEANGGVPATDPHAVARFMVQRRRLTSYQATALLSEPPGELRFGSFLIRSESCPPPFGQWLEATRLTDSRTGLLHRFARSDLSREQSKSLRMHQSIDCATLQPIEIVEQEGSCCCFSTLPDGQCLYDLLSTGRPLPSTEVCRIGIAIASALQSLHAHNVVHAQVRTDRIWLGAKGQVLLLRDPVYRCSEFFDSPNCWLDQIEDAARYAAPDSPSDDRSSDIYGLGCLLFHAATGHRPFAGSSPEQLALAHRTEVPRELASAISQGSSGDPLFRVIAYAMAKAQNHRFASAEKVSESLQSVLARLTSRPELAVTSAKGEGVNQESSTQVRESISRPYGTQEVTPPSHVSTDSPKAPPVRRRRRRRSIAPWVLGVLGFSALMLIVGLLTSDLDAPPAPPDLSRPSPPAVIPPVINRPTPQASTPDEVNSARDGGTGYEVVENERLLFVPPYNADADSPPLNLLPPGPAAIITIRPTDILNRETGSTWFADLSPELQGFFDSASRRLKSPMDSMRRLTIAMHPGTDGWPEVSLMAEFNEGLSQETLLSRLEVSSAQTSEGDVIYVGEQADGDAYFWKPSADGLVSQVAVGTLSRVSEVAALDGNPIPLPRSSQSLWSLSCGESEFVALITPNFLFADGRALVKSLSPELTDPLKRLLQPDVSAAIVSLNYRTPDRVFVEAIFAPSGGISEAALMRKIQESVESWPLWADQFTLKSVADPSWRLLASRLPAMIRFTVKQARFGVSKGSVIVNAYLPAQALPQVAVATVLALNTPPANDVATTTVPTSAEVLTVDEILKRPMTVSFDQESLEFALDAIMAAFKQSLPSGTTAPTARIVGGDLELMGITQNQQVRDFSKTDVSFRDVLTDLVIRANPDKSATGPSDPKQALIWVVAASSTGSNGLEILITTRQAAQSQGYELPVEFRLPDSE